MVERFLGDTGRLPTGLNIKNEETHQLVRELARLTGESMTAAVTEAVRERLDRVRRAALVKIERELDRLVQALMDGVPASRVKEKMTDLENRKAETEARIKDATDNPVLIHPNMANCYRDQIAELREALGDEHAQVQASEIIRKLVDKIVLVPGADDEGHTSLSMTLHGHLGSIRWLGTTATRPLGESGLGVGYRGIGCGGRI
jgi:hypothetical protein